MARVTVLEISAEILERARRTARVEEILDELGMSFVREPIVDALMAGPDRDAAVDIIRDSLARGDLVDVETLIQTHNLR